MSAPSLQRLLGACLLAVAASPAWAADEVAWVGSATLPDLLGRTPPLSTPATAPVAHLLAAAERLPAACVPAPVAATLQPLTRRITDNQRRLQIAEHFLAVLRAEDNDNLGTERVAANHGRWTRAETGVDPEAGLALEVAYLDALARRDAARVAHHRARLALGLSAGGTGATAEALDTETLAWPATPPALEVVERDLLERNPQILATARLQAHWQQVLKAPATGASRQAASCLQALTSHRDSLQQALRVATLDNHGRLLNALGSERRAAALNLSLAETRLDKVRAALPEGGDAGALHEAQISTGLALARSHRVRDAAVLADLRLQALLGAPATPATGAAPNN